MEKLDPEGKLCDPRLNVSEKRTLLVYEFNIDHNTGDVTRNNSSRHGKEINHASVILKMFIRLHNPS